MEFSFKKSDKNNFPCRTEFERISFSKGISLIKAKLFTGKTHQIRSTLCSMGYPVVGDKIYGKNEEFYLKFIEGKLSDSDRGELILKHQTLHSYRLAFADLSGNTNNVKINPPWFNYGNKVLDPFKKILSEI